MQKYVKNIGLFLFGLIAYIAISLLMPVEHGKEFWVAFGISILGCGISGGICYFETQKKDKNVPLFELITIRYSVIYFGIQLVVNFSTMILGIVPLWIVLMVNIILLALYIILLRFGTYAKNYGREREEQTKNLARNFKSIGVSIQILDDKVQNHELKQAIHKLEEAVKYSDPISLNQIGGIDENIMESVRVLENLVGAGKSEEAILKCNELLNIVNERNKICKLYK